MQRAGFFSEKAEDRACLACHDGPVHHAAALQPPTCAACHIEHRGRVRVTATSNQTCAACHSNLRTSNGISTYSAHVRSFEDGHPEFAAVRTGQHDPSTLKLNHAIHMKAIRRGPNGPIVQLACGDCHRPAAAKTEWTYADTNYVTAKSTYSLENETRVIATGEMLSPRTPATGRELMAPVKFATSCSGCHLLTFDKRFDEGVPHDTPEVIHAFLLRKFQTYIAAHSEELHVTRDPDRDLTGKPLLPETRTMTSAQWVHERTAVARRAFVEEDV